MEINEGKYRKIKMSQEDVERALIHWLEHEIEDSIIFSEDHEFNCNFSDDGLALDGVEFKIFYADN